MRKFKFILWILCFSTAVCSAKAFVFQEADTAHTPVPVKDIVYVRPFALSQGYQWSPGPEEPVADRGVIVVLRVDTMLVIPTDVLSPILYAGDRMLQVLNFGHKSGYVIGLIPGEADLSETLFWFGPPDLPGRVSPESIRTENTRAVEAGIRPFPAEKIKTVTEPAIIETNLADLLRGELADLVLKYAPEEGDLARKWRLPEAKKAEPESSQPVEIKRQRRKLVK